MQSTGQTGQVSVGRIREHVIGCTLVAIIAASTMAGSSVAGASLPGDQAGGLSTGPAPVLNEKLDAGGSPGANRSGLRLGTNAPSAPIEPGPPVVYARFDGGHETLTPWVGRNVAVLTPVGGSFSPLTMTQIIDALDRAWDFYESMTRHAPTPRLTYQGRDSIAVVTTILPGCAACSYLGATGSEILDSFFQILYDGVANHTEYDQVMFYEFGRNFWFYQHILAPDSTYGSTVATGFAILMRSRSMHSIGVAGAPFNGTPFSTFESQIWGIVNDYDGDLSRTFADTLAVGRSPSVYNGTDFFASILNLLASHYGGDCYLQAFFDAATASPSATTDTTAVTNFVNAASKAAGVDLRPFFYEHWSFPRPDGTMTPRIPGGIAALPAQVGAPSCAPTVAISPLPTWLALPSIPLTWSAMSVTGAVSSYDVRYRRAPWNGGFGSYTTWQIGTAATNATFGGAAGSTYCFSVRAHDSVGSASAWTVETCTAIPLDDRSLSRSGSWGAGTGAAYYKGTYLRSASAGAQLVRTGVVAKRIAIVATTCPTCGTVSVYWGSTLLRTISLHSASTIDRQLLTAGTFGSVRTGTLTIRIYSSGKQVLIDGLAIRRN